jgi:hypothetical protein
MSVMSELHCYSVVILTSTGGVISRHAGYDYMVALAKAVQRRQDFPDAHEVRVVSPSRGICISV